MRFLIAGYYGFKNAGDELILAGMLHRLRSQFSQADFTIVSGNPNETSRLHGVAASPWDDLELVIRAIEDADVCLLGGGGLFQDHWGVDESTFLTDMSAGITRYGSIPLIASALGKPSYLYGLGIGPLIREESRVLTREIVELAAGVTVRDPASKGLLETIGIPSDRAILAADPALAAPSLELPESLVGWIERLPRPLIGVSVRNWGEPSADLLWREQLAEGLSALAAETKGTLLFVPLHRGSKWLEDDLGAVSSVLGKLDGRTAQHSQTAKRNLDAFQSIAVLECCDLIIGMRLHSLVAGVRSGKPVIGIGYDPKIAGFMADIEEPDRVRQLEDLTASWVVSASRNSLIRTKLDRESRSRTFRRLLTREELSVRQLIMPGDPPKSTWAVPNLLRRSLIGNSLLLHRLWQGLKSLEDFVERSSNTQSEITVELTPLAERIERLKSNYERARMELNEAVVLRESWEERAIRAEGHVEEYRRQVHDLEAMNASLDFKRQMLESEMSQIKHSKGWRLLQKLWAVVWRARDAFKRIGRVEEVRRIMDSGRRITGRLRSRLSSRLPPMVAAILGMSPTQYQEFDPPEVVLYTHDSQMLPDYVPRATIPLAFNRLDVEPVTLIATCLNEAGNARQWFHSLENQTLRPQEVIIVDGGSNDGTLELLECLTRESFLNVRLISLPNCNIAEGRNQAIQEAKHQVIAVTDLGCRIQAEWLKNLIEPLFNDPNIDVVGGWYVARESGRLAGLLNRMLIPGIDDVNPVSFIPSSRSIAYRKSSWRCAGGYPEWLTHTGEDTYFALELRRVARKWAFAPDAVVTWTGVHKIRDFVSKLWRWSEGDGESGVRFSVGFSVNDRLRASLVAIGIFIAAMSLYFTLVPLDYPMSVFALLLGGVTILATASAADLGYALIRAGDARPVVLLAISALIRLGGYMRGYSRRSHILHRRFAGTRRVTILLAGVPMDDTGGGSRAAMLAKEFLRRGDLVIFCHRFAKDESIELGITPWHSNLIQIEFSNLNVDLILKELEDLLGSKQVVAIVEFPLREYADVAQEIREIGGVIIYDLIDHWPSELGGAWYSLKSEKDLLKHSSFVTATSPALVRSISDRVQHPVLLLPNAYDSDLFRRDVRLPLPEDFPSGSPNLIYVGALWGSWLDWVLIHELCIRFHEANIILIGDHRNAKPVRLNNLHYLGLKPQSILPAYMAHSDVGILPWKRNAITESVSPLKVYEYLAMGLPIVSPRIEPLLSCPRTFLANTRDDFLEGVSSALELNASATELKPFLSENDWVARVTTLEDWFMNGTAYPRKAPLLPGGELVHPEVGIKRANRTAGWL